MAGGKNRLSDIVLPPVVWCKCWWIYMNLLCLNVCEATHLRLESLWKDLYTCFNPKVLSVFYKMGFRVEPRLGAAGLYDRLFCSVFPSAAVQPRKTPPKKPDGEIKPYSLMERGGEPLTELNWAFNQGDKWGDGCSTSCIRAVELDSFMTRAEDLQRCENICQSCSGEVSGFLWSFLKYSH